MPFFLPLSPQNSCTCPDNHFPQVCFSSVVLVFCSANVIFKAVLDGTPVRGSLEGDVYLFFEIEEETN